MALAGSKLLILTNVLRPFCLLCSLRLAVPIVQNKKAVPQSVQIVAQPFGYGLGFCPAFKLFKKSVGDTHVIGVPPTLYC